MCCDISDLQSKQQLTTSKLVTQNFSPIHLTNFIASIHHAVFQFYCAFISFRWLAKETLSLDSNTINEKQIVHEGCITSKNLVRRSKKSLKFLKILKVSKSQKLSDNF